MTTQLSEKGLKLPLPTLAYRSPQWPPFSPPALEEESRIASGGLFFLTVPPQGLVLKSLTEVLGDLSLEPGDLSLGCWLRGSSLEAKEEPCGLGSELVWWRSVSAACLRDGIRDPDISCQTCVPLTRVAEATPWSRWWSFR